MGATLVRLRLKGMKNVRSAVAVDPAETTIFVYDAAGKSAPSTRTARRSHPSSGQEGAEHSTVAAAAEDTKAALADSPQKQSLFAHSLRTFNSHKHEARACPHPAPTPRP